MGYSRLSASQTIEITDPVSAKGSCQVSDDAITGSLILAVPLNSFMFYGGGGAGYYRVNLQKTLPSDVWGLEYAYTLERNQLGFHVQGGYRSGSGSSLSNAEHI